MLLFNPFISKANRHEKEALIPQHSLVIIWRNYKAMKNFFTSCTVLSKHMHI